MYKWQRALEQVGVEFIDETDVSGFGVRFKKGWPKAMRRGVLSDKEESSML